MFECTTRRLCWLLTQSRSHGFAGLTCRTPPTRTAASASVARRSRTTNELLLLHTNDVDRINFPQAIAGAGSSFTFHRRHAPNSAREAASGSPATLQANSDALELQQSSDEALDQLKAKEDLLASVDSVRRRADRGTLYLLESRIAKVLPQYADAASMVEDVGRLIGELELLKQEKAALAAFRHQTPKEVRREYSQMMLTGLATGLAAAIHPVFFIGSIYGLIRMRNAGKAEKDRDAGTNRMEEITRVMKQKKADLNGLLDELFLIVKAS